MFHKSSLKTWAFFICIAKIIKIARQTNLCSIYYTKNTLYLKNREILHTKMKISVCESCGEAYDYTGYPTCPECIRDGDTTKKSTEIPKLLQKDNKNALEK